MTMPSLATSGTCISSKTLVFLEPSDRIHSGPQTQQPQPIVALVEAVPNMVASLERPAADLRLVSIKTFTADGKFRRQRAAHAIQSAALSDPERCSFNAPRGCEGRSTVLPLRPVLRIVRNIFISPTYPDIRFPPN